MKMWTSRSCAGVGIFVFDTAGPHAFDLCYNVFGCGWIIVANREIQGHSLNMLAARALCSMIIIVECSETTKAWNFRLYFFSQINQLWTDRCLLFLHVALFEIQS